MDAPKPAVRTHRLITTGGLAGLMLLALVLRGWGLTWGLPTPERYYPYHPDETVLLDAVCRVNPLWLDFTPGFYNYGSFYILLTRIVYDFTAPMLGWGSVPRLDLPFDQWVLDFARLLLVGRGVTVALGVATIAAVFALGRRMFGARTGWLAAAFLAVAPLPVLFGHYMTVDVPSAFLVTVALFLGGGALDEPDGKRVIRWVAGAAFVGGLAVGTKYNTFPALLPLIVPIWQLWRNGPDGRRLALVATGAAIVAAPAAFFLATPGALLESHKFVEHIQYEVGRNKEGQGLIFMATPPTAAYHLGLSLPIAFEWPLYVLTLAGVAWSIKQRRPQDLFLWLFIVPFFLLLVPAERKFIRYITPLIPPLLVLAG
ncbi:MAG: ArnT family glycosyltransferase, partial [Actinomycetota bacterium]